jgi:hypothetical protein
MRRTFQGGHPHERRLDGRAYRLPGYYFFAVDPLGGIHRGNRARVSSTAAARGPFASDQLIARFADFEEQLRGSESGQEIDAETRAALEALGYAP